MEESTIAAIATAPGPAGVAIVRISGEDAWQVAGRVLRCGGTPVHARQAGCFFHAEIVDPETGVKVDDGVVLLFRGPASYTGEDVVELQGHGGTVSSRALLRAALSGGARMAKPGEFTRRAFVNGRLDLTQAEAVMDLVSARSDRAAQAAREQLAGKLGASIGVCYEELTRVCADVEARLDFEVGELPELQQGAEVLALNALRERIWKLMEFERTGRLLRDGALVAIAGCPNAGKSSLLNALLGQSRAIVSATPGTTRDTIEEGMVLDGIPLRLVDTAGLRDASCKIEQEGVARAHALLREADLVIYLIDASRPLAQQQSILLVELLTSDPGRILMVQSKGDLPGRMAHGELDEWVQAVAPESKCASLTISVLRESGLEELKAELVRRLGMDRHAAVRPGVSERHLEELGLAHAAMADAQNLLASGDAQLVLAAQRLRTAAEALGRITGRIYTEDLLDRVFSRFCIGK